MASFKVKQLNQHNLKVARGNIGCTTEQMTAKICPNKAGIDKVKLWEAGEDYPTFTQLKKLAHEYDINRFSLTGQDKLLANRNIPAYKK